MNLPELCIRRPVMTTLLMAAFVFFGLIAYRALPVSELPSVDFPTISVTANLPGASPETMAAAVATPLEGQFSTISGLDSMSSTSAQGTTSITLQFSLERNIDAAAQDVQSAIAAAQRKLPPSMPTPPSFRKINPADAPVFFIALTSPTLPLPLVNEYAETQLAQRLSTISGVAQVQVFGQQKFAVRVRANPDQLAARGMGIDELQQAIAQANLAGGGDAAQGRATSPLPYSALTAVGEDFEEMQRQLDAVQQEQTQLLAQLRQQVAQLPPPDPRPSADPGEQAAQEAKRRQLVKLLAEIEKRINDENARPKKRYISPATREEAYAIYYDTLRRKVEDKGTENFPEQGGKKLYGELVMIITVNHDGSVLDTEVVQSSGQPLLDSRAQAIARASGPFGVFNTAMRQRADQIAVVSRFKFTRDQTLQASTGTASTQP